MSRTLRISIAVAAGLALGAALQAGGKEKEKKIQKSDMPAAVQKAADQESAGATVKGYSEETENGAVVYQVDLVVGGRAKEILIGGDGVVVAIEEEVPWAQLPAEIQAGLKQQAGKGKIGRVHSITKHGTMTGYEAEVTSKGKKSEVEVGVDGKAPARAPAPEI